MLIEIDCAFLVERKSWKIEEVWKESKDRKVRKEKRLFTTIRLTQGLSLEIISKWEGKKTTKNVMFKWYNNFLLKK